MAMMINEWIKVLSGLVQVMGGVAAFAILVLQIKSAQRGAILINKVEAVHDNVNILKTEINGMQEKLVDSTAKASHAEGVADQRAKQDIIDSKKDKK